MSLIALCLVLVNVSVYGVVRHRYQGAAAHLWQLLMAGLAFGCPAAVLVVSRDKPVLSGKCNVTEAVMSRRHIVNIWGHEDVNLRLIPWDHENTLRVAVVPGRLSVGRQSAQEIKTYKLGYERRCSKHRNRPSRLFRRRS